MRKLVLLTTISLVLPAGVLAAQTVDEKIAELLAKIAELQAQVEALRQSQGTFKSFDRDLYYGLENDEEVRRLQNFLTAHGFYSGPVTGGFFSLTQAGVQRFQFANGIIQTGYFGPLSRAAANRLGSGDKEDDDAVGPNKPPVLNSIDGPLSVKAGTTNTWTIKAKDPENSALAYMVNWGDLGISFFSPESVLTHRYAAAGSYLMSVYVKDANGLTAFKSQTVRVRSEDVEELSVRTGSGLNAVLGYSFLATFIVDGGTPPYSWNASGIPEGLMFATSSKNTAEWDVRGIPTDAGNFTVTLTVKDAGKQEVSKQFVIKVSGEVLVPTSTLTVLGPNGGEMWLAGQGATIRWTMTPVVPVDIYAKRESNGALFVVAQNYSPAGSVSTRSFTWDIPVGIPVGQYRMRVYRVNTNEFDDSNAIFNIADTSTVPVISDIYPREGETRTRLTITGDNFMASNTVAFSTTEVSVSGGSVAANRRSLSVDVPTSLAGGEYTVTVKNASGTSNGVLFTVQEPDALRLTRPTASATWRKGTRHDMAWTSLSRITRYEVQLRGSSIYVLAQNHRTRNFSWTIPQTIADGLYRIRIVNSENSSEYVESDFDIRIE